MTHLHCKNHLLHSENISLHDLFPILRLSMYIDVSLVSFNLTFSLDLLKKIQIRCNMINLPVTQANRRSEKH